MRTSSFIVLLVTAGAITGSSAALVMHSRVRPCSQVLPSIIPAPIGIKPLTDGGLVALDLSNILVVATQPMVEISLQPELDTIKAEHQGQCSFKLPSGAIQTYEIYVGKTGAMADSK